MQLTKRATIKKELEIVKDSTTVGGYHRINKHYDIFQEASTQLVKLPEEVAVRRKMESVASADHEKADDLYICPLI
ncbi:3422_t:CDS:2 [Ambispora gerdemannii]|uniref:3422_t:CDS:1 n=1 Tax=Ambispora gerdemannii TaxID=144530 RepID=A0A9N9A0W4_9GLOM|nr:3422_t:CDS:2 [Ambispora gerdemannii]